MPFIYIVNTPAMSTNISKELSFDNAFPVCSENFHRGFEIDISFQRSKMVGLNFSFSGLYVTGAS